MCKQTHRAVRDVLILRHTRTHRVCQCPHVKFALDFYFYLLFTGKKGKKKRKLRRHSSEIESINTRRHASDLGAHVLVWCGSHNRWSGKPRPLVGCSLFITSTGLVFEKKKKKLGIKRNPLRCHDSVRLLCFTWLLFYFLL